MLFYIPLSRNADLQELHNIYYVKLYVLKMTCSFLWVWTRICPLGVE